MLEHDFCRDAGQSFDFRIKPFAVMHVAPVRRFVAAAREITGYLPSVTRRRFLPYITTQLFAPPCEQRTPSPVTWVSQVVTCPFAGRLRLFIVSSVSNFLGTE